MKILISESKKDVLEEGGNAALSMIPKLQSQPNNKSRKLFLGKISDSELDSILPEKYGVFPKKTDQTYVGRMLNLLGSGGLIDTSYSPKFLLGSSRLAAIKTYGRDAIWTDKYETDDIIQMVSGNKTEFGDIDVDIIFKADKKEIANLINSIDPSVYSAKVSSEINVAIRMGDKVIQVDLVDIRESPDAAAFLQKSSFLDLSSNIKGVFSIYLLRAVAAHMDIDPKDALDSILEFANKNPTSEFSKTLQKKIQAGWNPAKVRFSLGAGGLVLTLDLSREGSSQKIDFDINPRVSYSDLDLLAKQVLQDESATTADIFHAVKLAKFIGTKKKDKALAIWNDFEKLSNTKIKGGIDEKDFNTAMEELSKLMGITTKTSLKEARESIGRFEGKNQFTNQVFLEIL